MANNAHDDFLGMYITAKEISEEDSKHLASNESVIGSEVKLVFDKVTDTGKQATDTTADKTSKHADKDTLAADVVKKKTTPTLVYVESARGYSLGAFDASASHRIRKAADAGLVCRAFVSAVIYAENNGLFWAEYAIICYPADNSDIWNTFCSNASRLIAKGEHPGIKLSDKEIHRIVESNGTWFDVGSMERAKLPKGVVYFKKRRSTADNLVDKAVGGKKGCKVAATIFWIVLAIVVIALIWAFVIQ